MSFIKYLGSVGLIFVSTISFAQSAQHAVHFGLQVGNFYENLRRPGHLHTGALPFTMGYDYYPVENYGFRISAYISPQKEIYPISDTRFESKDPNYGDGNRKTTQFGFKVSTKFWLKDITETNYDIGFETGFGLIRYQFINQYTYYRTEGWQERLILDSEAIMADKKVLTPIHFGVAAKLFGLTEVSFHYNYFPSLVWPNETNKLESYDIEFQQPKFRKSFISVTSRIFLPW